MIVDGISYVSIPWINVALKWYTFSMVFKFFWTIMVGFIYSSLVMRVSNRNVKYLYLVAMAEITLFINFTRWHVFLTHVPIVFTYFIAHTFPTSKWMPWSMFFLNIAYLLLFHWQKFLDISLCDGDAGLYMDWAVMIALIPITSYAWDVYDVATTPPAATTNPNIAPSHNDPRYTPISSMSSSVTSSKDHKDDEHTRLELLRPKASFLEYLAYVLIPAGLFTGPTISLYEFRKFMQLQAVPNQPGRYQSFLMTFALGALLSLGSIFVYPHFAVTHMSEPWFRQMNFAFRLAFCFITGSSYRWKMYGAWYFAEAAYVAMGMGLKTHADGSIKWDGRHNADAFLIESSPLISDYIFHWNIFANRWLHRYVYRRLQHALGKESTSMRCNLFTFAVSAIWHGFYPGYYMFFITVSWMSVINKGKFYSRIVF